VLVCSLYLVQVQAEIFGMSIGGLKIGQLAEAAEVNFETVRYYERIGLMPRPIRTKGGHRHYGHEHLRRLTFIRRARELGFHLEEIRSLLVLNKSGNGSCADVKAIAANHLADVREKISALAKMERTLAILIEGCSEERSLCPILDMLDSERNLRARTRTSDKLRRRHVCTPQRTRKARLSVAALKRQQRVHAQTVKLRKRDEIFAGFRGLASGSLIIADCRAGTCARCLA